MQNYYRRAADAGPRFPAIVGAQETGVLVVGGGFAGLATAFSLMERGVRDVVLLEAHQIGHGASGRNGGFVFGGFSLDNRALVQQLGLEPARALYQLTLDAVARIRRRIIEHNMACEAEFSGVILANWFDDDAALRRQQDFMQKHFGVDWQWLSREQLGAQLLSTRYTTGLHEPNAFHFQPLLYAQAEARALQHGGLAVHEQSPVLRITPQGAGWRVDTAQASIQAREVVVCCGAYGEGLVAPLARAVMPIATYVMATEPLGARLAEAMRTKAAVYDTRFAFDYYRPLADTRILWGGRISIQDRAPEDIAQLLYRDLLRVYPQLKGVQISDAWSGLMAYARHSMPQIGRLPSGLWYATGFGGHGVAPTTLAGEVLAQALCGEAAIPAGFATYGLPKTFGAMGRMAAQTLYWWLQWRDRLRES